MTEREITELAEFFNASRYGLIGMAVARLGVDNEDAEDFVSSAMLGLLERAKRGDDIPHDKTLLRTAVVRDILNAREKKSIARRIAEQKQGDLGNDYFTVGDTGDLEDVEESIWRDGPATGWGDLAEVLEELPGEEHELISLLYHEGYTVQEAADEIGISLKCAEGRKARALDRLRKMVGSEFAADEIAAHVSDEERPARKPLLSGSWNQHKRHRSLSSPADAADRNSVFDAMLNEPKPPARPRWSAAWDRYYGLDGNGPPDTGQVKGPVADDFDAREWRAAAEEFGGDDLGWL
jgi:RNA polymerase sigma factor (sigma-70 family)